MANLVNTSNETLGFTEVGSKGMSQPFAEAISLHTFYPASPFFRAADLGLYSAPMSAEAVEEFIRTRAPIGFSPFREFVASEYKFQQAYVQFVFKPLDGSDAQLSLTTANVKADVPDRFENDTGTVTNASSGLTITFTRAFVTAPKVTVTPVSTSAVIAVLTATPTTTGFTVKLFNTSGTAITGSFFWTASGY